jgi:Fe-S cluster assembly protein SufD
MTLAAVIERSEAEREAWRYTSLARLKGVFGACAGDGGVCENANWIPDQFSFAIGAKRKLSGKTLGEVLVPNKGKDCACLVFLNGVWQEENSYLNGMPEPLLRGDAREGYTLELAVQTCLALSPLELLFLNVPGFDPVEATITLRVSLGASSRLTLIERHCDLHEGAALAYVMEVEVVLAEGAKLVHGKIVSGDAYHLSQTDVHVARGAYYDHFSLLRGGKLTRNETHVTLAGALAQCRLQGVTLLRDDEHADTTTRVAHAAPGGSSRQYYKSVVDDHARGVFQGKIIVAEGAQKTDAYQLSRALLLSDKAEMDAKPELEIYADDVSCSHGSTTADLDEAMLFYLQSRGLGEREARALLIEAFANELLETIQAPELRALVDDEVQAWLHP